MTKIKKEKKENETKRYVNERREIKKIPVHQYNIRFAFNQFQHDIQPIFGNYNNTFLFL